MKKNFDLGLSWNKQMKHELEKPYVQELSDFVSKERALGKKIYPPENQMFNAFFLTPFEKVKVVIIGQDPYHGPGQAHGLCFSVTKNTPLPPSLKNIFKELQADIGSPCPSDRCLNSWAQQGVFLLNAVLTVEEGKPLSHHKIGWESFTDAAVEALYLREDPLVFLVWGKLAERKIERISQRVGPVNHIILKAAHPSPLSVRRGFFGCKHFSKTNKALKKTNKKEISWSF